MTAESPLRPRTLADLRSILLELECVIDVAIHNAEQLDWRDPWMELVVDSMFVPPELCKEVGKTHFGISDFGTQGYEFAVVEIKEVPR